MYKLYFSNGFNNLLFLILLPNAYILSNSDQLKRVAQAIANALEGILDGTDVGILEGTDDGREVGTSVG